MSAYGTITLANRPVDLLPPTTWDLPQPVPSKSAGPFRRLVLHHLRLDNARALPSGSGPSLLDYTHRIFAAEVEAGQTYPQETDASASASAAGGESDADEELGTAVGRGVGVGVGDAHAHAHAYTRAAFEAYFWAADVIIAIGIGQSDDGAPVDGGGNDQVQARVTGSGSRGEVTLEVSRAGRRWEEALVGFYYVKPNYPGRSSHICNAGFVIPPAHRGFGYGKTLGKSYLDYGPALGYKASVFNLVYANNTGSLRIWDSLGFTRAGLIPRAGRLRRADGNGEEWVDSVIYYRSFVDDREWARPIER